ncbi:MAG: hypothetical protein HQL42_15510 [Alphaproteobacteria bacterium]|nr:hypothetical protein [Alphaproteobacteria bacterium]
MGRDGVIRKRDQILLRVDSAFRDVMETAASESGLSVQGWLRKLAAVTLVVDPKSLPKSRRRSKPVPEALRQEIACFRADAERIEAALKDVVAASRPERLETILPEINGLVGRMQKLRQQLRGALG